MRRGAACAAERGCPDHSLHQTELGALRSPDQVAAEGHLEPGSQAEPLHGGERGTLDLGESPDHRHELLEQLARRRLVAVEDQLDVRPGREVVTLCAHQHRACSAFARLARGKRQVAYELEPEEIEGWIGDHDLPDVAVQPE